MGLAALRRILQPTPCELSSFTGRVVAVDADNQLWSFVTAIGAAGPPPTGPDGRSVAHVLGLLNRLKLYAANGIRSGWVFDGEQPALKEATLAARWERIEAARADGDERGGIALTSEQIKEAKALLTALGVPWLVAPGESDAQCAHFARTGAAWAAVTQDYDAALHGCPRTGRNLTGSKTRTPELIDLAPALAKAGLTREQLVDAAILIGTDYNEGIAGIGPVKAVKLVQKQGDLFGALRGLGAEIARAEEIRQLFLDHVVDKKATLEFRAPDPRGVGDLVEGAGLSRKRGADVGEALAKLHAAPPD